MFFPIYIANLDGITKKTITVCNLN